LQVWTHDDGNPALPEVETLVERVADRALEDFPTLVNYRSNLVQSLVKALEVDPGWIQLYDTTGRLEAPKILNLEPELGPAIFKIEKVPSRSTWETSY
jgi:hypothetical protein